MISTIALIVASITACGTVIKEINICLNKTESQSPAPIQQIVNQSSNNEHGLDEFINKQLDQRDSDTEIDIKINVSHPTSKEER